MYHRFALILIFLPAMLILGCQNDDYVQYTGYAQGGQFHITYKAPVGVPAKQIHNSIDSVLSAIDKSISGYNKGSILSKVNDNQDVILDSIFVSVFRISERIYASSRGAFDPSAAPLFDLWGFGFANDTLAGRQQIDSVLTFVGMEKCAIVPDENGSMRLKKTDPRIKLNFNAIAQGFSCDLVANVLKRYGCSDYIIEIGGEIVCAGESSRKGEWRIWIDKPIDGNNNSGELKQDILNIKDCGVVTSGNYRKFYIKDGQKYSHTIDPSSGCPVTHSLLSATVIAPTGAEADAYATWLMVAGTDNAKEIVERLGIEAYLVYGEQEDMKVWHTAGLVLDSER